MKFIEVKNVKNKRVIVFVDQIKKITEFTKYISICLGNEVLVNTHESIDDILSKINK